MDSTNTINSTSEPTSNLNNVIMQEDSSNQNLINTVNPVVVMEKKKRGRKKTIKPDMVLSSDDTATETATETAVT